MSRLKDALMALLGKCTPEGAEPKGNNVDEIVECLALHLDLLSAAAKNASEYSIDRIYGYNVADGKAGYRKASHSNTSQGNIPIYGANGRLRCGDAIEDLDVANKQTVVKIIEEKLKEHGII